MGGSHKTGQGIKLVVEIIESVKVTTISGNNSSRRKVKVFKITKRSLTYRTYVGPLYSITLVVNRNILNDRNKKEGLSLFFPTITSKRPTVNPNSPTVNSCY